jgi:ABC-type nitrate/sulfonate/bicarbonate transport system ATPase subunit
VIEIKDLVVKYRRQKQETVALDGINLRMASGDIYTFIGPSGCGKSTLLYVLSGILREYTGKVTIDGHGIDPKTQRIGLILQNYGLLPWKNVYQNITLGIRIKNGQELLDDYGQYILEQLGIDEGGKVWILEVNSKPSSFDEDDIRMKHLEYLCDYFIYAARQKNRKGIYEA